MILKKIICVAGLPGSGKSTWAENYSKKHHKCLIWDDEILMNATPQFFIDNQKIFEQYKTVIFVDVNFCVESIREKANTLLTNLLGIKPEWVYFENDAPASEKNSKTRVNKKVSNLIKQYTKIYNPPKNSNLIPVFKK